MLVDRQLLGASMPPPPLPPPTSGEGWFHLLPGLQSPGGRDPMALTRPACGATRPRQASAWRVQEPKER